jgi:hypothetical protein
MPTIIYKQNPGLTPEDMAKVAVFANHVERNCFDDFPEAGSRNVSEGLSRKVRDVLDAFRDPRQPTPTEKAVDQLMALDSHVGQCCFDKFGDRGAMGKTIELLRMSDDIQEIIEKLVIIRLSEEELAACDDEFAINVGGPIWVDDYAPKETTTVH